MIGTLAIDGCVVTFGTARNVTVHTSTASVPTSFLPRDAMRCISAAYAVMRCLLSVCPCVHVCVCHVLESPLGSHTILVFFYTKRGGAIPTGTPLTGASNAGGVGKKRDS